MANVSSVKLPEKPSKCPPPLRMGQNIPSCTAAKPSPISAATALRYLPLFKHEVEHKNCTAEDRKQDLGLDSLVVLGFEESSHQRASPEARAAATTESKVVLGARPFRLRPGERPALPVGLGEAGELKKWGSTRSTMAVTG